MLQPDDSVVVKVIQFAIRPNEPRQRSATTGSAAFSLSQGWATDFIR